MTVAMTMIITIALALDLDIDHLPNSELINFSSVERFVSVTASQK